MKKEKKLEENEFISKWCPGHKEFNFDNPAKKLSPKDQKIFSKVQSQLLLSPKLTKKKMKFSKKNNFPQNVPLGINNPVVTILLNFSHMSATNCCSKNRTHKKVWTCSRKTLFSSKTFPWTYESSFHNPAERMLAEGRKVFAPSSDSFFAEPQMLN